MNANWLRETISKPYHPKKTGFIFCNAQQYLAKRCSLTKHRILLIIRHFWDYFLRINKPNIYIPKQYALHNIY